MDLLQSFEDVTSISVIQLTKYKIFYSHNAHTLTQLYLFTPNLQLYHFGYTQHTHTHLSRHIYIRIANYIHAVLSFYWMQRGRKAREWVKRRSFSSCWNTALHHFVRKRKTNEETEAHLFPLHVKLQIPLTFSSNPILMTVSLRDLILLKL